MKASEYLEISLSFKSASIQVDLEGILTQTQKRVENILNLG